MARRSPATAANKRNPDIVSVQLPTEAKQLLNQACEQRGMTIKSLLGRLIAWFVELDPTEQAMALGHVDQRDLEGLAELVRKRRPRSRRG